MPFPIPFAFATTFTLDGITYKAGAYEVIRAERWSQGEIQAWIAVKGPQGGGPYEVQVYRPEGFPTVIGDAMGRQTLRLILAEFGTNLLEGCLTSQNSTP